MNGIDYSAWRPPSPQWLLQNGFGFVVRYLKVLPNSYAITAAEYRALEAAGVAIVLNWEEDTNDWQTNGISYAQQAKAQAQALGAWPCPIYFSIDTGSPSMAAVDDYFAGVASVIGPQYTGIYGGYDVVTEVDKRYVSWFWQTYAWSNGRWADVHIRQVPGGTNNYDLNQAMTVNFGQVGAAQPDPPAADPPRLYSSGGTMVALLTTPTGRADWFVIGGDKQLYWHTGQGAPAALSSKGTLCGGGPLTAISASYWGDYSNVDVAALMEDGGTRLGVGSMSDGTFRWQTELPPGA